MINARFTSLTKHEYSNIRALNYPELRVVYREHSMHSVAPFQLISKTICEVQLTLYSAISFSNTDPRNGTSDTPHWYGRRRLHAVWRVFVTYRDPWARVKTSCLSSHQKTLYPGRTGKEQKRLKRYVEHSGAIKSQVSELHWKVERIQIGNRFPDKRGNLPAGLQGEAYSL